MVMNAILGRAQFSWKRRDKTAQYDNYNNYYSSYYYSGMITLYISRYTNLYTSVQGIQICTSRGVQICTASLTKKCNSNHRFILDHDVLKIQWMPTYQL